jgi:hypothetical protein
MKWGNDFLLKLTAQNVRKQHIKVSEANFDLAKAKFFSSLDFLDTHLKIRWIYAKKMYSRRPPRWVLKICSFKYRNLIFQKSKNLSSLYTIKFIGSIFEPSKSVFLSGNEKRTNLLVMFHIFKHELFKSNLPILIQG